MEKSNRVGGKCWSPEYKDRNYETKYKGYDVNGHRGVAQGRYDGCAVTPDREHIEGENPNLKDLAMPFKDFMEMNGVPLVMDFWAGPFTAFGSWIPTSIPWHSC